MSSPRYFQGVKNMYPNLTLQSSKGSIVKTECGRTFLDFTTGIGVTNLGHSHNGVTKAVQSALSTCVHAQQNIIRHKPMHELIKRLADLSYSKTSSLDSWFFWNSGSEAVEASIKLARHATNKPNIIVMNLGYHGRTIGTMALTTSGSIYRSGFSPLMGGVIVAPFPYVTQGPYGIFDHKQWGPQSFDSNYNYWGNAPKDVAARDTARCLDAVELILRSQSSPSETAAILLEPVLGEGGYVPCPPGFLKGLREICTRNNILLICDEVQTGYGRTGAMFASEWIDGGVAADILVSAKGIANGFPLSAVGTRSELSALQPAGSMGGTYGANALSCVAALAVLDAFSEERVLENIAEKEAIIKSCFAEIQSRGPSGIREVRGAGMMFGVEFERSAKGGSYGSYGSVAQAVVAAAVKRDLLLLSCGPYDTVRLIPPLNISNEDLKKGMTILGEAIAEVASSNR